MSLKGYIAYHKTGTMDDIDRAHGGVSIFDKNKLPQSLVDVNSPLQTTHVKVTPHTTVRHWTLDIQGGGGGWRV